MTQDFPRLVSTQVALTRAEFNTGTVLDENYLVAVERSQSVYTIFESADRALMVATDIVRFYQDVECYVQDASETVLYYVHRDNLKFYPQS